MVVRTIKLHKDPKAGHHNHHLFNHVPHELWMLVAMVLAMVSVAGHLSSALLEWREAFQNLIMMTAFPLLIVTMAMMQKNCNLFKIMAVSAVIAPLVVSTLASLLLKETWTSTRAFGIRGVLFGMIVLYTMYLLGKKTGNEYQVLSLASFAMASYLSCGLGTMALKEFEPLVATDMADLVNDEKSLMSTIQLFFGAGAVFQLLAVK